LVLSYFCAVDGSFDTFVELLAFSCLDYRDSISVSRIFHPCSLLNETVGSATNAESASSIFSPFAPIAFNHVVRFVLWHLQNEACAVIRRGGIVFTSHCIFERCRNANAVSDFPAATLSGKSPHLRISPSQARAACHQTSSRSSSP
ncbi:hypothetical protein PENTCL1PPCAC_24518, partial [Pristionchus entomophagus]